MELILDHDWASVRADEGEFVHAVEHDLPW